tara:strand:+ start:520 stop:846 length:327 start_codon:yes stop_codon:yes gene_type:complete
MNFTTVNDKEESVMNEMCFDKNASTIEKLNNQKVYAQVTYIDGREHMFKIRIFQNSPYDPLGAYGKRENYIETKLKKVSKNTFDFYMMYLKTNNSIYMTKAQRGFLND